MTVNGACDLCIVLKERNTNFLKTKTKHFFLYSEIATNEDVCVAHW